MTDFDLWVNSCANDDSCQLWCLEGSGKTGMYQTKKRYLFSHNYFYTTPVYHVWIDGKCVVSITDYTTAYRVWDNRKNLNGVWAWSDNHG